MSLCGLFLNKMVRLDRTCKKVTFMKRITKEATIENVLKSIKENKYNRNQDVKDFIEALEQIEGNMFISLDAKWGAGKSFYVRQIEQTLIYLTRKMKGLDVTELAPCFVHSDGSDNMLGSIELKNTYLPIYYDAWLYDSHDDPLMSLVLVIIKGYEKLCDLKLNEGDFGDKVIEALDSLVLSLGPIQIGGNLKNTKGTLEGKDILASVKTAEEIRIRVKEVFDNIIVENVQKLVIFVDELDRCRPAFAMEMLERIKHYFDDDRIIFVASINREQLVHLISNCYGTHFDSTGYLDKFFDRNVYLPPINMRHELEMDGDFWEEKTYLKAISEGLNDYYRLSLRENLRFYEYISYAASSKRVCDESGQGVLLSTFVPIIAILSIKDEDKKSRFMKGDSNMLRELFKKIPALYRLACRFGQNRNDESAENFENGYGKIEEVYDYSFGIGEKRWYRGAIEISDEFARICIRLCNGFGAEV